MHLMMAILTSEMENNPSALSRAIRDATERTFWATTTSAKPLQIKSSALTNAANQLD
jgi:hypothetical protein